MIGRKQQSENGFWKELGESLCAPLYFSFTRWVKSIACEKGLKRVLFLSREGDALLEAWHLLYPDTDVRADYLLASRRCVGVASIKEMCEEEMDFILSGKYPVSLGEAFRRLGWDHSHFEDQAKAAGITDSGGLIETADERARFRRFIKFIESDLLSLASGERKDYLGYLNSLDLLQSAVEDVGIVDVGWQGSIQQSLQALLNDAGSSVRLHGFYLGTIAPIAPGAKGRTSGLLFEDSKPAQVMRTVKCSRELVELLFPSRNPTLMRIAGEDSHPLYADVHENSARLEHLMTMRDAAMQRLAEMAASWDNDPYQAMQQAISRLSQLLRSPTREESEKLGDLMWSDGLGNATRFIPVACPGRHLINLPALVREYKDSYWRSGYLARLGSFQRALMSPFLKNMPADRSGH
jgi:hypothetical protein